MECKALDSYDAEMQPPPGVPRDFDVRTIVFLVRPDDEALALARQDRSVLAGRLRIEAARWWTAAGRISFPQHDGPVGERLSLGDMR